MQIPLWNTSFIRGIYKVKQSSPAKNRAVKKKSTAVKKKKHSRKCKQIIWQEICQKCWNIFIVKNSSSMQHKYGHWVKG